jgi:hypothetical protein
LSKQTWHHIQKGRCRGNLLLQNCTTPVLLILSKAA